MDVIQQCAFSYKSECQKVETKQHPYIDAIYDLIELNAQRFFTPLYFIDWIYFLTPAGRRHRRASRVAHCHSEAIIKERKWMLGLDNVHLDSEVIDKASKFGKHPDFLDILLMAKDEVGNGLTDIEMRNEVDTFMFEGHDTTTSGISWTLYCLAQHPEHQEKVREEVKNVLMGREWLEYEDLKELRYTQWCIKEAMRLYPPVFAIFRETSEDIQIEKYMIPKGVHLFVMIYNIHRNPEFWPDPDKFDPLRFHPDNAEGQHPYAYVPFSAGQRNCIGQNFALNGEKIAIASIVYRFHLSVVKDHTVEIVPKIVLRTKNDIKVQLEVLDNNN